MRRLIIGDIHGCYAELLELLEHAGLAEDDEVIALGDILDRGPDSPQVLDFFTRRPNARFLMGNHERKHVRALRGETELGLSERITRRQLGEARYLETCALLERLPRFLELPQAILVHGFFEPGVPLAEQREEVVVGTMRGEKYLWRRYGRPWYELYDGEKPILVGHRDYLGRPEPFVSRDRVYGLDTGCYRGGALTGLVLPEFRLVSVPSRKDYWAEMKRRHSEPA